MKKLFLVLLMVLATSLFFYFDLNELLTLGQGLVRHFRPVFFHNAHHVSVEQKKEKRSKACVSESDFYKKSTDIHLAVTNVLDRNVRNLSRGQLFQFHNLLFQSVHLLTELFDKLILLGGLLFQT